MKTLYAAYEYETDVETLLALNVAFDRFTIVRVLFSAN